MGSGLFRGRSPRASASARCAAASTRIDAGTTSSTRPIFRARLAFTFRPVSPRSSASARLVRSATRCSPSAPGSSPSCTSGRPTAVFPSSDATRPWQASASSKPPPRHGPWIAATIGFGNLASRSKPACALRHSASAAAAVLQPRSIVMSAPTMNESRLPEASTTAFREGSFSTSASACSSAAAVPSWRVFTGSPGRS